MTFMARYRGNLERLRRVEAGRGQSPMRSARLSGGLRTDGTCVAYSISTNQK